MSWLSRWRGRQIGYNITLTRLTGLEGTENVTIVGNCPRAATVEEVAAKVALMGEAARRRVEQNNRQMEADALRAREIQAQAAQVAAEATPHVTGARKPLHSAKH